MGGKISRRTFLRLTGVGGLGLLTVPSVALRASGSGTNGQYDPTAIESKSVQVEFTLKMDRADKRTKTLTGKYANHGEPYRENPRTFVEYTLAMDRADERIRIAPAA